MRFSLSLAVGWCLLLFASGCLSSTHSIPRGDLVRLAHAAPEERGERVRVVQTFVTSEQPPKSSSIEDPNTSDISLHVDVGSGSSGRGSRLGTRSPRGPRSTGTTGGGGQAPRPTHGTPAPKSSSSGTSGGGIGSSLSGIDGDAAAVLAVVVVASAAVIAVVAAGSEGARYDGWARLGSGHPVHLYGPHDGYKEVALRELTVEDAQWAERAYVRKSEGSWQAIRRAPLDRKGWAYSVFLGAGELGDAMDAPGLGPSSHIQLGYFPIHEFGLHADLGFGWGEANGPEDTSMRFSVSTAVEAQLLPFHSGRIHAGAFALAGRSTRTRSAGGGTSALYSTGALMQVDLTTRLAITGRAGVTRSHNESASEMSLGLSIY